MNLGVPTERIKTQYLGAVGKFLERQQFILGKEVEDFERAWAKILGARWCLGTSSGSDALYLALAALGIGEGDEVITQGNAYNATVTAIMRTGAAPRFADIRKDTLLLNPSKIENLITARTKAILPVHLYGQPCDMEKICAIARAHKLFVVEDCAQAHLALFKKKLAGLWGDIGAFSFYPTKNLGAFGDAGAVVTSRKDLYEKMRAIRNLGQAAKNDHRYFGFNMRLDGLQAICLSLKLKTLGAAIRRRQERAGYYDALLKKAGLPLMPVGRDSRVRHVYHLYVVELIEGIDREKLRVALEDRGVETAVHYPLPVYRQPWYAGPRDQCPVSDRAAERILSLPFFENIKTKEQEYLKKVSC